MSKIYQTTEENHKLRVALRDVGHRFHQPLMEAGVTVEVLIVENVDKNGERIDPALKLHGYPAMAVIKINSLQDRAEGKADVTLKIDGHNWDELSAEELDAVLDHELTHLELKVDGEGAVMTDDLNRPLLRMRRHDFEIGGFHEIAQRHKEQSIEVQAVNDANRKMIENGCFSFSGG